MSVKYDRINRRQFLIGTGGYFLVLPFLPSLLSKEALAQVVTKPKRLLVTTMGHNMMSSQIINPALATQTLSTGARQLKLSTSNAQLATFLTHPTYTALKSAGLITMVRGLDCMTDQSGHGSMWLTGVINTNPTIPSIDSYMEASQSVYPSASSSGYLRKVIRCNEAYSYKKVGNSVTYINEVYADDANNDWNGAASFYNDMLGKFSTGSTTPPPSNPAPSVDMNRRNILNEVYSAYQSAKNNRRISANDKSRLDEHMQGVLELQNSIVVTDTPPPVPAGQACSNPTSSSVATSAKTSYTDRMEVFFKLMRIALTCNLTKVGYIGYSGHASYDIGANKAYFPTANPLHNGVFHNEGGYTTAEIEQHYTYWMKWHSDKLADLILEPLRTMEDVQTNNGKSYLDNMLVAVLSESGVHSNPGEHSNVDYMPILLGNMGGAISSDKLVVFDRTSNAGLPYNTLLITLLEAMGVPASEYQAGSSNGKGFGQYVSSGSYVTKYGSRMYSPITEIWNG